jgi:hypothetical protein
MANFTGTLPDKISKASECGLGGDSNENYLATVAYVRCCLLTLCQLI